MSTMTMLPTQSFLPSGSMESDIRFQFPSVGSEFSSSLVSPLALPRGASGYFDISMNNPTSHPSTSTSHWPSLSPASRGPQFLSPHLTPITREAQYQLQQQQRSASLPPVNRGTNFAPVRSQPTRPSPPRASSSLGLLPGSAANSPRVNGSSSGVTGVMPSISSVSSGHPRAISADSANAPSHVHMIRRLVQQNGRIREAWEAERKYMEANRERAEEVYKEERAFMEEERDEWEAEKASLLQEIERLHQQVVGLGGDTRLGSDGRSANRKGAFVSGQTLRGGGTWEASPESMRSSFSSQGNTQSSQRNQPWHTASNPQITGEFGQLNHVLSGSSRPVPVVDVQEIHPELEGIPIKATTIQKCTFTDTPSVVESKASSRASSPPATGYSRPRVSSGGSSEQTLQALAADETDRLTMHAGHTPSHSLSLLPTIASSGVNTASSSGDSTPKIQQHGGVDSRGVEAIQDGNSIQQESQGATEPFPSMKDAHEQASEGHPDSMFEPTEDRELKGPLMLRNMPAHDEIFFQKLSDKLEEVRKDTNAALPAVLKDAENQEESTEQPSAVPQANGQGASGKKDPSTEKDGGSRSGDEEELDIPLKIKPSFNFGAPFGERR
ncbi:hypothetical protein B0T17DRAFT_499477 [Bombardia bombarda]|uniref:Uncharacterized protein n=1 Tax=Bombardia bombarda TaxID=252184 RepID=A0AA39U4K0_9PEZI|nr:hypothetical protein B0T17DRAFT_499477 [Bombardia bombarda]